MRRRFGDRSAGDSVLSLSQLDRARTRDQVGSPVRVLVRVLNYPGSGSKFGSREPGYPLTSLVKVTRPHDDSEPCLLYAVPVSLEAGGGLPCRPNPAATLLVVTLC